MSICQGFGNVPEIPRILGQAFEIRVLSLKSHAPVATKWTNPKIDEQMFVHVTASLNSILELLHSLENPLWYVNHVVLLGDDSLAWVESAKTLMVIPNHVMEEGNDVGCDHWGEDIVHNC